MNVLEKDFDSNILHVGCGNSQLGRLLHDAGFVNATRSHQICLDRACDMLHAGVLLKLFLLHVCPSSSRSL